MLVTAMQITVKRAQELLGTDPSNVIGIGYKYLEATML